MRLNRNSKENTCKICNIKQDDIERFKAQVQELLENMQKIESDKGLLEANCKSIEKSLQIKTGLIESLKKKIENIEKISKEKENNYCIEIDKMRKENDSMIEKINIKYNVMLQEHREKNLEIINETVSRCENKIKLDNEGHQNEIIIIQEKHSQEIGMIRKEMEEAAKRMDTQHKYLKLNADIQRKKVQELQADHDIAIQSIKTESTTEIENIRLYYENMQKENRENHKSMLAELTDRYERNTRIMNERNNKEADDLGIRYQSQLIVLTNEKDKEIEELKSGFKETLRQKEDEHQESIDSYQTKIQKNEILYENAIKDLNSKKNNEIINISAKFKLEIKELLDKKEKEALTLIQSVKNKLLVSKMKTKKLMHAYNLNIEEIKNQINIENEKNRTLSELDMKELSTKYTTKIEETTFMYENLIKNLQDELVHQKLELSKDYEERTNELIKNKNAELEILFEKCKSLEEARSRYQVQITSLKNKLLSETQAFSNEITQLKKQIHQQELDTKDICETNSNEITQLKKKIHQQELDTKDICETNSNLHDKILQYTKNLLENKEIITELNKQVHQQEMEIKYLREGSSSIQKQIEEHKRKLFNILGFIREYEWNLKDLSEKTRINEKEEFKASPDRSSSIYVPQLERTTTDFNKSTINVVSSRNVSLFPIVPGRGSVLLSADTTPLRGYSIVDNQTSNPFRAATNNPSTFKA